MRKFLTDEQKALIPKLQAQGVPLRQIAERVGCSKFGVQYQLAQGQNPKARPHRSDAIDARIKELVAQGLTSRAVAKDIGIGRSTALRWAAEIGAKFVCNFDWDEDKDAQLRGLLAEGKSFDQVASAMGIGRNAVVGRAHRIGAKSWFQYGQKVAGARLRQARPAKRKQRGLSAVPVGEGALPSLQSSAEPVVEAARAMAPVPRHAILAKSGEGCRYPLWGDEWPTHRYCDAPRVVGESWCEKCCDIVFTKVSWSRAA